MRTFTFALVCISSAATMACANAIYAPGNGVSVPQAVKRVRPEYPDTAKNTGRQGTVLVNCIVLPDGTVGEARVTRSLDPILDKAAVAAAKQFRFSPGMKDGKPVSVRVPIEFTFTLR